VSYRQAKRRWKRDQAAEASASVKHRAAGHEK
jgi:hypothetical protein